MFSKNVLLRVHVHKEISIKVKEAIFTLGAPAKLISIKARYMGVHNPLSQFLFSRSRCNRLMDITD
jgi:hypothetical protein